MLLQVEEPETPHLEFVTKVFVAEQLKFSEKN